MPADRPRTTAGAPAWRWGWTVPPAPPEAREPPRAAPSPPRTPPGAAIAVGWGLPRAGEARRRAPRRPRPAARPVTDPSPSDHQPVSRRP